MTRTSVIGSSTKTVMDAISRRCVGWPPWALVIQLFFGIGWARAAVEKLIDPAWWRGDVVRAFLTTHEPVAWAIPLVEHLVTPRPAVVALVVLILQVVAATTLLTGQRLTLGLSLAVSLNLAFLSAGAVNPSAFYLVGQGALAVWLVEAGHLPLPRSGLETLTVAGAALAAFNLPLIGTINPHAIIDDPAAMLVTISGLCAVACYAELLHRTNAPIPAATESGSDATPQDTHQVVT